MTVAAVIATYDPDNPPSTRAAQVAMLIGRLINRKFGRDNELESDALGVCVMNDTGYDPQEMINVMQISETASRGDRMLEFFSMHPNSNGAAFTNRMQERCN